MSFAQVPSNKRVLILTVATAGLIFFVWLTWDMFATETGPPVFIIREESKKAQSLLLIRRTTPNGHLLIKFLDEDIVYRFDLNSKTADKVDVAIWYSGQGEISICDMGYAVSQENAGAYRAYGGYALTASESPGKSMLAVVSAYGPRGPNVGWIGLGGGGKVFGQRYLEIKENDPNRRTIGNPIRLPGFDEPSTCWSRDERLLLIRDRWNRLAVYDRDPQPVTETDPEVARPASLGPISAG